MKPIESKKFGDLVVEIFPDEGCESPLEGEGCATLYEYGGYHKEFRGSTRVSGGEDDFLQHLATLIHPDFPDDDSPTMQKHREAIVAKHFARSQVPTQSQAWLEIVVPVAKWAKEGSCLSAQEFANELAKTYRTWAEGGCVGYVTKDEAGAEVDSCWGFYSCEDAYESAKENFPTRDDQYFFDKYENQGVLV